MTDLISTLGIYALHISLFGAQREYQSTRLLFYPGLDRMLHSADMKHNYKK